MAKKAMKKANPKAKKTQNKAEGKPSRPGNTKAMKKANPKAKKTQNKAEGKPSRPGNTKGKKLSNWSADDLAIMRSMAQEDGLSAKEILKRRPAWSKSKVYRAAEKLSKDLSVERKRGQGRKATASGAESMTKLDEYLDKDNGANRHKPIRLIGRELGVGESAVRRMLKKTKQKSFRKVAGQRLSNPNRQKRLDRAKKLLGKMNSNQWPVSMIWWSDEKLFRLNPKASGKTNARYIAPSGAKKSELRSDDIVLGGSSFSPGVMCSVACNAVLGATDPVFCTPGCKINAAYYVGEILSAGLFPKIETKECLRQDQGKKWVWQQDGAPAHTSRECAAFLDDYLGSDRWIKEWMPDSPDCSPLDFCIWGISEGRVRQDNPSNLHELRASIHKQVSRLEPDIVRKACESVPKRLQALIDAEGAHFEFKMK